MTNVLDALLERVGDEHLRSRLADEIARLRDAKQFGLVFERHIPETARLLEHPIMPGEEVQPRRDLDGPIGLVLRRKDDHARVHWPDGNKTDEPLDALVVVRSFGEPVYPGLRSRGQVERGGEKPPHIVINGENYHALEALGYTHRKSVDLIYIDPPYNLGGDLTYNDQRVGKEDVYRHSKWLSFIDRRLRLARDLLTDTGIIIVAIDDTEQAHLRMLMDETFGESNFLATLVWQGGRKNDSKYVSVGHDYMLLYARDQESLDEHVGKWRERKPGVEEALSKAAEIWEEEGGDHEAAEKRWRKWLRDFKQTGIPTDAVTRYGKLHPDTGKPIRTDRDLSWPGGGGPRYDVIHPVTAKPCAVPTRGWMYSDPERMQQEIDAGRIYFGPDETTSPAAIGYLEEMDSQVPESVFIRDRNPATVALKDELGEKRFTHPKDANILARWIDIATASKADAVVLDYFAGSGSTAEAVMHLNARDGGSRQAILVTNNEVDEKRATKLEREGHLPGDPEWERWGIFEYVAKPRLETLVTGKRPDGSTYSEGLEENLQFWELTYLDRDEVARGRTFADVAALLWLRAGGQGPIIGEEATDFAPPEGARYAVLFDSGAYKRFADSLQDRTDVAVAYVVTDSEAQFQQAASELPAHVDAVMLYEDYLRNFEIHTGDQA